MMIEIISHNERFWVRLDRIDIVGVDAIRLSGQVRWIEGVAPESIEAVLRALKVW